ncbi:MAG: hypothetical protein R3E77_03595 [Steroidobacteraceae bacterium]
MTSIGHKLRAWLLIAATLVLAACGGGGSAGNTPAPSSGCDAGNCGELLIGLTDADGDFLSYTVDVVSLSLRKANGATVEALPNRLRVDFADLVTVNELISAAAVPNGSYVAGSIRLDYSNADINVDVGGESRAAVAVDANGAPLGVLDLDIQLDNRKQLVIAPGRPALLELDFDLAASNSADLAQNPVAVSVSPFLVASVEPIDGRERRVRGPLVDVNPGAFEYTIDVRPFRHPSARHGRLTVHVTDATAFEIDGIAYSGSEGLRALATKPAGTPTAAFGTLSISERSFTAERVHAGSSVDAPDVDALRGTVIARSGDRLTVRGGTLLRRDGTAIFQRRDVTVLVGPDTGVTRDGAADGTLDAAAISVGQVVHAFGQFDVGDPAAPVLDATAGRVRLHLTPLAGRVVAADAGEVRVELAALGRLRPAVMDFTGTGATLPEDADPADYQVATDLAAAATLEVGSAVRAFGFVTPFGSAAPDYRARTLVSLPQIPALLAISWQDAGSATPFLSVDVSGIVLDTMSSELGTRHHIVVGDRLLDLATQAAPLRIVARENSRGLYAIEVNRRIEIFSDFADYTAALTRALNDGHKLKAMIGSGEYDAAANELASARMLAKFGRFGASSQ